MKKERRQKIVFCLKIKIYYNPVFNITGEDISHFADKILTADVVTTQFTGLGLQSGNRYYSNVRAINKAGLRTLRSSDGFVVDLRQPDAGLVFDGIGMTQNAPMFFQKSNSYCVNVTRFFGSRSSGSSRTVMFGSMIFSPCNQ